MEKLLLASVLIVLLYVFINGVISKEIFLWEPLLGKRILLTVVVWLIPFLGAIIAYKILNLNWFKNRKKNVTNEQSNISGALLEVDSIFNPGQRHVIEQKQKKHSEQTEDVGEDYQNKTSL